eukprot:1978813-Rhodomonas_salina.1
MAGRTHALRRYTHHSAQSGERALGHSQTSQEKKRKKKETCLGRVRSGSEGTWIAPPMAQRRRAARADCAQPSRDSRVSACPCACPR